MVEVPDRYRQPTEGSFLLTTVYSQTPITAGEWILGQLSPIVTDRQAGAPGADCTT
jgi:hypothetical protein